MCIKASPTCPCFMPNPGPPEEDRCDTHQRMPHCGLGPPVPVHLMHGSHQDCFLAQLRGVVLHVLLDSPTGLPLEQRRLPGRPRASPDHCCPPHGLLLLTLVLNAGKTSGHMKAVISIQSEGAAPEYSYYLQAGCPHWLNALSTKCIIRERCEKELLMTSLWAF